VALISLFAAVMTLNLLSLMRYPAPFVDEGWLASRAWGWINSGRAISSLDAGVWDKYDGYWTYFFMLGTWFQALGIQAFGLSLFSVRLVSLVFGLILLAAVYVIADSLYGRRIGLLTIPVVALSLPFLMSSHWARYDIMAAAFGFGAIALYVTDRASGFSIKSFLAGLAISLAFEMNPTALIYGPAVAALYLLDHGWATPRSKRFWSFAVGTGIGLVFYAVMHVLPYSQTYFVLSKTYFGTWRTPPLLVMDPMVWIQALAESLYLLLWSLSFVQAPVFVVALAFLARRRSRSDKVLLILFLTLLTVFTALFRIKSDYYAILISPVASLAMAVLLDRLSQMSWRISDSWWGFLRTALPWSAVLGGLLVCQVIVLRNDPTADFGVVLDRVKQAVPQGGVVMGPQTYWFGLPE
jgi:4-amino-4-deoxy-L-arabinose transferase-like glycosyltransferase